MTMHRLLGGFSSLALLLVPTAARAGGWAGLEDRSDALGTEEFAFNGSHPDMINGNENYYDGDIADFDGDGLPDRALGARYGLLLNTGEGAMTALPGYTGFLLRGMPGASGWGEDGFGWADVDNDLDPDCISGGNGEPLVLQTNRGGRFSTSWQLSRSALNIVSTDVEGDGDVDLAVAHAFCNDRSCGGPVEFSLLINDGDGTMSEESAARGLAYGGSDFIVGVISADWDGDGDFDLVIEHGTEAGGTSELARNDGSGNYAIEAIDLPITCSGFGSAMTTGDYDGDGDLDLVLGRCGGSFPGANASVRHAVGINDGTGSFTNESATRLDPGDWGGGALVGENAAAGDLDYDGDLDLVSLHTEDQGGMHHLQVFLNDGTGTLVYEDTLSHQFVSGGAALGADVELADLDGDGSLDVWVGIGGDRVREFINTYVAADGLPADTPRGLVAAPLGPTEVDVAWDLPSFATSTGHYRLYRASSPGLGAQDRELVAVIGNHHGDESFAVPITEGASVGVLGHPDASVTGGQVHFVDRTVLPGQIYQYSVAFVGTAHTESPAAPEVTAIVPADAGADADGPRIAIVSPTEQHWYPSPRIVAHLADGAGVDPQSLEITFDRDLGDPGNGGRAAGEDVSDLAYRLDGGVVVIAVEPPLAFADGEFVTMTVTASDLEGNTTSEMRQFLATNAGGSPPTAAADASAPDGAAPVTIDFDASGSSDADGKIVRYEWYFGDGTTALGRVVSHEFAAGGDFDVKLVVRDNDGGVGVATTPVSVRGEPAPCEIGQVQDCYDGAEGTEDVGVCHGGTQQCGPGGWGECIDEVAPVEEDCGNTLDDDCDGDVDGIDDDCGGPGDGTGPADDTGPDSGDTAGPAGSDGSEGASGEGSGAANDDAGGCGCSASDGEPRHVAWLVIVAGVFAPRRRRV